MKKVNFNSLKNIEVPQEWIEDAVEAGKSGKYTRRRFSLYAAGFAASIVLVTAASLFTIFSLNGNSGAAPALPQIALNGKTSAPSVASDAGSTSSTPKAESTTIPIITSAQTSETATEKNTEQAETQPPASQAKASKAKGSSAEASKSRSASSQAPTSQESKAQNSKSQTTQPQTQATTTSVQTWSIDHADPTVRPTEVPRQPDYYSNDDSANANYLLSTVVLSYGEAFLNSKYIFCHLEQDGISSTRLFSREELMTNNENNKSALYKCNIFKNSKYRVIFYDETFTAFSFKFNGDESSYLFTLN